MADDAALLLVHGDEPHLVDASVNRWRAAFGDDDLEVIDAPARLDALVASLVDMPLFGGERRLLVRDLPQLAGSRKGAAGVDELCRALAMRSPTTRVCFAVRGTVAPTNAVLLAIVAQGGQVVHHQKLRPSDRRRWLENEARSRAVRLPPGGIELLLRCTGGDLAALSGELDKLAAFGAPSRADLEHLVAGTEQLELYRVLDLLAGDRPAEGAALLAELVADGRSTQYLLSILAGQLRDLLMVHALALRGVHGSAALAAAMRIPAWRAERLQRTARAIPATAATRWMGALQRIDAGVKAGEVDDAAALQLWGLAAAAVLAHREDLPNSA